MFFFTKFIQTVFPKSRVSGRRPFLAASIILATGLLLTSPINGKSGSASGKNIQQSTLVTDQIASDDANERMKQMYRGSGTGSASPNELAGK